MDQKHGCFASAPSPAAAQMPSRTQPPRPSNGSYDYGLCTGADLATPALGATVSVTGPYVLDADHGWMEIHPVWSITVLAPAASSAPAASPHSGRQLACLAGTKDGLVTAIAAPANDGYSGDYDVHITSDEPDQEATASGTGDTCVSIPTVQATRPSGCGIPHLVKRSQSRSTRPDRC